MAGGWFDFLQFAYGVPFGISDPIFGRDISFYVFRFPVWDELQSRLFMLTLLALAGSFAVYLISGNVLLESRWGFALWPRVEFQPRVRLHLALLVSLLLALMAFGTWLDGPRMLVTDSDVLFGAALGLLCGAVCLHPRLLSGVFDRLESATDADRLASCSPEAGSGMTTLTLNHPDAAFKGSVSMPPLPSCPTSRGSPFLPARSRLVAFRTRHSALPTKERQFSRGHRCSFPRARPISRQAASLQDCTHIPLAHAD